MTQISPATATWRRWTGAGFIALAAFCLGTWWAAAPTPTGSAGQMPAAPAAPQVWTCSMHPEVRLPGPGKCPKCGMDLIPEAAGHSDAEDAPRRLTLSAAAKSLAEVETSEVRRGPAAVELRLVGKLDFDESRVRTITAWFPGRLTRLFVDYTGIPIKTGEHLVEIYSPELYAAQQEYLQAKRVSGGLAQTEAAALAGAAREKLLRLGLSEDQLAEIDHRGTPEATLEIRSPLGGIVVEKNVRVGQYVETGTPLYTVADLTRLWLRLSAYESDLAWLRYGQTVEFTTDAYPGEKFTGWISFIDPLLDEATRTVKVRVIVDNAAGQLKPNLFAHAVAKVPVDAAGLAQAPDLTGRWLCPMHPEILKDAAGKCDICGMPLDPAEKTASASPAGEDPLLVPVTAPLLTGTRALAYVEVQGADRPTYEGREIELGPRAGEFYVVRSGLKAGEKVVTRGNFMIDASLQIRGKNSMMNPPAAMPGMGEMKAPSAPAAVMAITPPAEFQKQLGAALDAYLALTLALAQDNEATALKSAQDLQAALGRIDMKLLDHNAHLAWMKLWPGLTGSTDKLAAAPDLAARRIALATLSEQVIAVFETFQTPGGPLNRFHCPMALDNKGADWLDTAGEVRNPYFGSAMFSCGELVKSLREKK